MTDPASAVERIATSSTPDERREAADDAVDETTESHQAAEGTETTPSISSRAGLKDALLRSEPNRPLHKVESPWNPEQGGITRIYRGLQKALEFSGAPAIVDIVVGAAEFVTAFEPAGAEEAAEQDDGDQEASDDGGDPTEDGADLDAMLGGDSAA